MIKDRVKRVTKIAVITAATAVSAQIMIPLPGGVPATLQTACIAVSGYYLGWKTGFLSYFLYIAAGLIGIPVFSGFTPGVTALFGKTGGFILGFFFLVLACGVAKNIKSKWLRILLGLCGLILNHLCGILGVMRLTESDFVSAFLLVSLPFTVKDVLSVAVAETVAKRLCTIRKKE